ncbi:MAG: hypothetical protein NDJ90_12235 [Oligoflexia bacterium]|nr:hypothetical protein [Oligoflexia bacterium]
MPRGSRPSFLQLKLLCLGLLAGMAFGLPAWSKPSVSSTKKPGTQIKVTLFGHPCVLQGPTDVATLNAIHSVSPEQTYTIFLMEDVRKDSAQQLKDNVEKLKKASPLPAALKRYRDALIRRLTSQIAFVEGLQAAQAEKKSAPLLAAVRPQLQGKNSKAFEEAAKKLDRAGAEPALYEQLLELYGELIEPDPEEEFHRAIRALQVQYSCSYGEVQEREAGAEEAE